MDGGGVSKRPRLQSASVVSEVVASIASFGFSSKICKRPVVSSSLKEQGPHGGAFDLELTGV